MPTLAAQKKYLIDCFSFYSRVLWDSMEFNGTACVIEIGALQVPWNSMELH